MSNITMKNLLESGVHFGHQTRKWNPKMAKYIFGARNNIHIIDLQKTVKALKIAYQYIKDESSKGKITLFVGTKRQAQDAIKEEALRADMYYINSRWLGGTLTNFQTIKNSINRLKELEELKSTTTWEKLSKKEIARLEKEFQKLDKNLSGIKNMPKLPDMIVIIDPEQEQTAVNEAKKLGIPIISVVDTNCDPDLIDVPVPGNDDAIRAIKLFLSIFTDAILEGKNLLDSSSISTIETSEGDEIQALNSTQELEEDSEIIKQAKKFIKKEEIENKSTRKVVKKIKTIEE